MNKFKGPEEGRCLEYLKNKKEGKVAGKRYPKRKTESESDSKWRTG